MKHLMASNRYMDPEELAILKDIEAGKYKTLADLEAAHDAGLMADFAMLSYSGYCGFLKDGSIVLTDDGKVAVAEG